MEIEIVSSSAAKAGFAARELERSLIKNGLPQNSLKLRSSTTESMDIGSILGIDMQTVMHGIESAGAFACLVKCVLELRMKHPVTIRIENGSKSIEVGPNSTAEEIQQVLSQSA